MKRWRSGIADWFSGGPDLVVLLGAFVVVVLAWTFVNLADDVTEGDTQWVDEAIVLSLRDPMNPADPIGPPWFEHTVRDLTSLGSVPVLILVTLAICGYLLMVHKYHALYLLLAASVGAFLLSSSLKYIVDRPRPDVVPHMHDVVTTSFPSGHAAMGAAIYLTLGALVARMEQRRRSRIYSLAVALFLAFVVGLSRIYMGVHYPSDVFAGWTAGLAWAIICWMIARTLQRRGKVESAGEEREAAMGSRD